MDRGLRNKIDCGCLRCKTLLSWRTDINDVLRREQEDTASRTTEGEEKRLAKEKKAERKTFLFFLFFFLFRFFFFSFIQKKQQGMKNRQARASLSIITGASGIRKDFCL